MPKRINADKPHLWKADVAKSVDQFNQWFMQFTPDAFRSTRIETTEYVKAALLATRDLRQIDAATLKANPGSLPTLRMCTAPPLTVDRLIGLSGVGATLVGRLEAGKLPTQASEESLGTGLAAICGILTKMLDRDIFPWLDAGTDPTAHERDRSATVVADRLWRVASKDAVRRTRRDHYIAAATAALEAMGYRQVVADIEWCQGERDTGTYSVDVVVPLAIGGEAFIKIDIVVRPISSRPTGNLVFADLGLAEDTRRATRSALRSARKAHLLRQTYRESVKYFMLLSGYYGASVLGMLASELIDWVRAHNLDHLAHFVTPTAAHGQNLTLQLG